MLILFLLVTLLVLFASKQRPIFFLRIVIATVCLFAWKAFASPESETSWKALFFDVGQGDCCLLQTPDKRGVLIDCGGVSGSGTTKFERCVLPYLREEGVTVTQLYISHAHLDHYGGASQLIQQFPHLTVFTSGEHAPAAAALELEETAMRFGTRVRELRRGQIVPIEDARVYVLNPSPYASATSLLDKEMNHNSLVLLFELGSTRILFLGDIEADDEVRLLDQYGDLVRDCQLVKVAHHGSRTSSSQRLVRSIPRASALISVGRFNHFGHPAPEVVDRWRGHTLYRTDRDGAIGFSLTRDTCIRFDPCQL